MFFVDDVIERLKIVCGVCCVCVVLVGQFVKVGWEGGRMDVDEICVVFVRVLEFYVKFNEVIECVLMLDVVQSIGDECFDVDFYFVFDGDEINGFERFDRDFSKGVEGNVEVRILGLICDMLDIFEGQFEVLQVGCLIFIF